MSCVIRSFRTLKSLDKVLLNQTLGHFYVSQDLSFKMIPHMTPFPSCVIRFFRNLKGLDKVLLDVAPDPSFTVHTNAMTKNCISYVIIFYLRFIILSKRSLIRS